MVDIAINSAFTKTPVAPKRKMFYIFNTDGKPRLLETPICVKAPKVFNPSNGKNEHDWSDAVIVRFKNGEYATADEDIISYLTVYATGGEYTWRGQKMYKEPEQTMMFKITDKMEIMDKNGTMSPVIVKTQLPKGFASTLSRDYLESFAIEVGVKSAVGMDKQAILDKLESEGYLS